jgi:hypothetical protein
VVGQAPAAVGVDAAPGGALPHVVQLPVQHAHGLHERVDVARWWWLRGGGGAAHGLKKMEMKRHSTAVHGHQPAEGQHADATTIKGALTQK